MTKLRIQIWPICAGMALLLTFSTAVQAQTPDGLTPAVETVCDRYEGALFGLCNAYCEATDCGHPDVRAADRACSRIQANFFKHSGGELIPEDCQKVDVDDECPCFTTASISAIGGDCVGFEDSGAFEGSSSFQETFYMTEDDDFNEYDWAVYSEGTDEGTDYGCMLGPDPDVLSTDSITLDEANLCWTAIVAAEAGAEPPCD
ncbi:MAG: hypothetical protein QNK19_13000 [Xanthomonadales bacterium]|nr:hypothetical protein [Xanthomonadales bacterium]